MISCAFKQNIEIFTVGQVRLAVGTAVLRAHQGGDVAGDGDHQGILGGFFRPRRQQRSPGTARSQGESTATSSWFSLLFLAFFQPPQRMKYPVHALFSPSQAVELPRPVTGDKMTGTHLVLHGILPEAPFGGVRTPGGKAASGLGVDGRGDFAFELDVFLLVVNIGQRHGGKQRLGVGVQTGTRTIPPFRLFPPSGPGTSP